MVGTVESKFRTIESGVATAVLVNEHNAILAVLNHLEKAIIRLEAGLEIPLAFFEEVTEFLTVFVDKCHHGKEEDILFPLLQQAGIPKEGGPIGCMLDEHIEGRNYIKEMRNGITLLKADETQGKEMLAKGALGYIWLLRQHIIKENNVLFKMADMVLPAETQAAVAQEFDRLEEEKMGKGTHERFHAMIDGWAVLANEW
jgi:hemerythrin-like domain-containing protein